MTHIVGLINMITQNLYFGFCQTFQPNKCVSDDIHQVFPLPSPPNLLIFKFYYRDKKSSSRSRSDLDLLFIRDNSNNITTKLDDKRDTFGFHIVNFPFMSSNIPSAPVYGVYASQLIRYARCCPNYSDFLSRHRALVTRLLSQGYKVNRLSNTFKKFYGRHTDLSGQYKKSVCQMFAGSIS